MCSKYEEGLKVFREMLPNTPQHSDSSSVTSTNRFAHELRDITIENVFGTLWTRPGLNRRSRSLVTLGILIALRATGEMAYHFPIALRNGVTREELEEVIYHATAYAGFPAASEALNVASKALDEKH